MGMSTSVTPPAFDEEPRFPDSRLLHFEYDKKRDTLTLSVENPGPAVSIDLGDGLWMRFVPATREVVGFEIEEYERIFLRRYPDLAASWRSARGRRLFGMKAKRPPERFYDSMIQHVRHAFAARPRQLTLPG